MAVIETNNNAQRRSIILVVLVPCLLLFLLPVAVSGWTVRPAARFTTIPRTRTKSSPIKLHTASTTTTTDTNILPRLSQEQLRTLQEKKYVVINDFISSELQESLQNDVKKLRENGKFNIAKIGQDATNTLNTDIRIAETCFIGPSKLSDVPNPNRNQLYEILDTVRNDLSSYMASPLDKTLTELLYAYYPEGGYYRRHRDAAPQSASTLRKYSLLLYLNAADWNLSKDGGALRIHLDGYDGDELPDDVVPEFIDVNPKGGTLVLFQSDALYHEVCDTNRERMAIVGWYNRPVQISDAVELSSGNSSPLQLVLLAVAAALVTVGVVGLVQ